MTKEATLSIPTWTACACACGGIVTLCQRPSTASGVTFGDRTAHLLARCDGLHALQRPFIEHDVFQCGYCNPVQLCSAMGLMAEFDAGLPSAVSPSMAAPCDFSDDEIRERMIGNLCRCAAHVGNCAAIQSV